MKGFLTLLLIVTVLLWAAVLGTYLGERLALKHCLKAYEQSSVVEANRLCNLVVKGEK